MNIILIVVDTLRYDFINAHGRNDWIQTPNFDGLAEASWIFDNAYSASYPTIPHRTDVMTGEYGAPFHPWMPLRHDRRTFPELLGQAGYATQLIHDTPHLVNGGHNFDYPFHAWTYIRGAEVDRPWIDHNSEWPCNWKHDPMFDFAGDTQLKHKMIQTYARANRRREKDEDWNAAQLFIKASNFLKDNSSRDNFFLWIDCFDPHEPWDVPPEFAKLYDHTPGFDGRIDPRAFITKNEPDLEPSIIDYIKCLYAAKVSWVDKWLGRFLDTLNKTKLTERTAIILTADHGTNLYERGRFGKSWPAREQESHVPFLVRAPKAGTGRSDMLVQPQDVFATVMGLAGEKTPENLDSHDVLALAQAGEKGKRGVALTGRRPDAWKTEPSTCLFTVFDGKWYLQFDIKPEADVLTRMGEIEPCTDQPEEAARLRKQGLAELKRRKIDPRLLAWVESCGEKPIPDDVSFWEGWPGPENYDRYFNRLYEE